MELIVIELILALRNNSYGLGILAIGIGFLILTGLIYLFINRNEVFTLSYGLTLLSMVFFLAFFILVLISTGIYLISA